MRDEKMAVYMMMPGTFPMIFSRQRDKRKPNQSEIQISEITIENLKKGWFK